MKVVLDKNGGNLDNRNKNVMKSKGKIGRKWHYENVRLMIGILDKP